MRLLSLEVANYRNIAAAQLEPGRELTVICGNNGQGKTNLLEAIWLLTGGKASGAARMPSLCAAEKHSRYWRPSPSAPGRRIRNRMNRQMCRITVGTPDAQRPGRYASVNGSPPKRAAGLAGSFPAVVFDPGHLSLVKGAPEGRRRFLDAALCQLYPGYLATYRRYVRALQQKNALLRHSAGGTERPWAEKCALLEVLNVELAAAGRGHPEAAAEPIWPRSHRWPAPTMRSFPTGQKHMAVRYAAQFRAGRAGRTFEAAPERRAARRAESLRHSPRGSGPSSGWSACKSVCESGTAAERRAQPENGRSRRSCPDHRANTR